MLKHKKNNETTVDQANSLNRFVESTIIKGDITTESNIRIDGKLIGNLSTTGKLVIGKSGVVEGNIVCSNADIEGEIVGTIKVDGLLVIKQSANIKGDMSTHKIKIDENAVFNGNINMDAETHQKFDSKINLNDESEIVY
jgi:cytoskeletal protein CcmA (bactofilin family)